MSAIFETCNRDHNILELVNILTNFSFATTETEFDINNINFIYRPGHIGFSGVQILPSKKIH